MKTSLGGTLVVSIDGEQVGKIGTFFDTFHGRFQKQNYVICSGLYVNALIV